MFYAKKYYLFILFYQRLEFIPHNNNNKNIFYFLYMQFQGSNTHNNNIKNNHFSLQQY